MYPWMVFNSVWRLLKQADFSDDMSNLKPFQVAIYIYTPEQ